MRTVACKKDDSFEELCSNGEVIRIETTFYVLFKNGVERCTVRFPSAFLPSHCSHWDQVVEGANELEVEGYRIADAQGFRIEEPTCKEEKIINKLTEKASKNAKILVHTIGFILLDSKPDAAKEYKRPGSNGKFIVNA